MPLKWTKKAILEEAKKYKTRSDFNRIGGRPYKLACEGGFLDEACAHMTVQRKRWTHAELKAEAQKYDRRGDFMKANPAAFSAAHRHGVIDKICKHMGARVSWILENVRKEALKYKTRGDFGKKSNSAYVIAHRNGWLDDVCSHMIPGEKGKTYWTQERIAAEAKKHKSRISFTRKSPGAYSAAQKLGIIDQVCAHIPIQRLVFDSTKRAFLYYVRIDSEIVPYPLYKIGVSNGSVAHRFRSESAKVTAIKVWTHKTGKDAVAHEKEILKWFKKDRYSGAPVLSVNGNTELFTKDILGLDTGEEIKKPPNKRKQKSVDRGPSKNRSNNTARLEKRRATIAAKPAIIRHTSGALGWKNMPKEALQKRKENIGKAQKAFTLANPEAANKKAALMRAAMKVKRDKADKKLSKKELRSRLMARARANKYTAKKRAEKKAAQEAKNK